VEADDDALALVARAADGAMRDAESLLERLLVEGERVTLERAEAALGLPPGERLVRLAVALADGAWDALLGEAGSLYRDGFAPRTVAEQLGRTLRDALFAAVTGDPGPAIGLEADDLARAIEALDDASERFVRQNDLYALEVALLRVATSLARGRLPEPAEDVVATRAPEPLARAAPAAFEPNGRTAPEPVPARRVTPAAAQDAPAADRTSAEAAAPTDATASEDTTASEDAAGSEDTAGSTEATGPAPGEATHAAGGAKAPRFSWHPVMARAGTQLKAFLLPATADVDAGTLTLRYDERHAFHFGQLRKREQELLQLLDDAGAAWLEVVIEGPGGRDRHGPRSPGGAADAKKP
jgi:DNA polymerase III subunit gamma/tau